MISKKTGAYFSYPIS